MITFGEAYTVRTSSPRGGNAWIRCGNLWKTPCDVLECRDGESQKVANRPTAASQEIALAGLSQLLLHMSAVATNVPICYLSVPFSFMQCQPGSLRHKHAHSATVKVREFVWAARLFYHGRKAIFISTDTIGAYPFPSFDVLTA